MSINIKNGYLNWLYRIFVAPDNIEEEQSLSKDSKDDIEKELAKSSEELEKEYERHFHSSNKNKDKFKVDKEDLHKDDKSGKHKADKVVEKNENDKDKELEERN